MASRPLITACALALVLAAAPVAADAEAPERVVLWERDFAQDFVGAEAGYVVLAIPSGYEDLRVEAHCNLNVGAFAMLRAFQAGAEDAAFFVKCQDLQDPVVATPLAPGHYYGAASFAGVNEVTVRVTGVPQA